MTGSPLARVPPVLGHDLSALASANGCINDAARAWFSLGRDRYLPTWFSAVHPKYRTPYRSILFLLPIALAFAFIADLNQAITFSILSGVLQLHVHEHQHHDVPEEMAARHRSGAAIRIRSIRSRRSCCSSCAW